MRKRWIRDEVILGLDVLFNHGLRHFVPSDPAIMDLSRLLNRLPIIPVESRNNTFRNVAGVRWQLSGFLWSLAHTDKNANIAGC